MLSAPQLSVKMSMSFKEEFEKFAAKHDLTMSAVMSVLISNYLGVF